MFTSGFFNSVSSDRRYNAEQMSAIFDGLINDGIFDSIGDHFRVTPAASGLGVSVGTGRAWLNSTWSYNDSAYPITLSAASASLGRKDLICLKVDKSTNVRANSIVCITGTPASTPVEPTVSDDAINEIYYHKLAAVLVSAGATSITSADITNYIGLSTGTPYVTGIIDSTSVDELWSQWDGEFNAWWEDVKTIIDEDTAAQLSNRINHITPKESTMNLYGFTHINPPASSDYTYQAYSTDAIFKKLNDVVTSLPTAFERYPFYSYDDINTSYTYSNSYASGSIDLSYNSPGFFLFKHNGNTYLVMSVNANSNTYIIKHILNGTTFEQTKIIATYTGATYSMTGAPSYFITQDLQIEWQRVMSITFNSKTCFYDDINETWHDFNFVNLSRRNYYLSYLVTQDYICAFDGNTGDWSAEYGRFDFVQRNTGPGISPTHTADMYGLRYLQDVCIKGNRIVANFYRGGYYNSDSNGGLVSIDLSSDATFKDYKDDITYDTATGGALFAIGNYYVYEQSDSNYSVFSLDSSKTMAIISSTSGSLAKKSRVISLLDGHYYIASDSGVYKVVSSQITNSAAYTDIASDIPGVRYFVSSTNLNSGYNNQRGIASTRYIIDSSAFSGANRGLMLFDLQTGKYISTAPDYFMDFQNINSEMISYDGNLENALVYVNTNKIYCGPIYMFKVGAIESPILNLIENN